MGTRVRAIPDLRHRADAKRGRARMARLHTWSTSRLIGRINLHGCVDVQMCMLERFGRAVDTWAMPTFGDRARRVKYPPLNPTRLRPDSKSVIQKANPKNYIHGRYAGFSLYIMGDIVQLYPRQYYRNAIGRFSTCPPKIPQHGTY